MSDSNANTLSIRELKFSYDDTPLLSIDEFQLPPKQRVAVMGPSGCGKTTFMHLISGLIRPQRGSIEINGQEITGLSEWAMDRVRGKEIGIVFQRLHLMPAISLLNNLLLAQKLARVDANKLVALELLQRLGIEEFADTLPSNLSQGQAQRAAIARALVHKPSLVIADEPTSALDSGNAKEAIELLSELSETANFALLVVTHDERVRSAMDRVYPLGGEA